MNLTLIGFSGCGKSYIGKLLAEKLSFSFLDLDEAMEVEYGKSLPEILESLGDDRFIDAEEATAIRETKDRTQLLVSTGGSIVYAPKAMEHLSSVSRIVYLDVPYEVIESRVAGKADRMGRIVRLGDGGLRELFESRVPLYKKYAHFTVHQEGSEPSETIERIAALVR